MMTASDKQAAIHNLLYQLTRKTGEYNQCLRMDANFEVKKKIRMRLTEIKKQIKDLKEEKAYFIPDMS